VAAVFGHELGVVFVCASQRWVVPLHSGRHFGLFFLCAVTSPPVNMRSLILLVGVCHECSGGVC
jgi:hypothetical protein